MCISPEPGASAICFWSRDSAASGLFSPSAIETSCAIGSAYRGARLGAGQTGFDEARVGARRLAERRSGLLRVARLKVRQRDLIVGCREPGLALEHLLKVLDRVRGLGLGELHSATEKQALEIGRVLLESRLKGRGRIVVPTFQQSDLREPVPCRKEARGLLRDLDEQPLAFLGLAVAKMKIREREPGQRAARPERGGRFQLPLGLSELALALVEVPEYQVCLDRPRLPGNRVPAS